MKRTMINIGLVTIGFVLFILLMIFCKTEVHAAEINDPYENYRIVKNGLNEELVEMSEDEEIIYLSAEIKEVPSEKVCVYRVKYTTADDGEYLLYCYLNGETDEVMAVLYDSEGEVVDSTISTITKEAEYYRDK